MEECIKPNIGSKIQKYWRQVSFWTEEIDSLFKIYFKLLDFVYEKLYSGEIRNPGEKNYMSRAELKKFAYDVGLINDCCGERMIDFAFNLSK